MWFSWITWNECSDSWDNRIPCFFKGSIFTRTARFSFSFLFLFNKEICNNTRKHNRKWKKWNVQISSHVERELRCIVQFVKMYICDACDVATYFNFFHSKPQTWTIQQQNKKRKERRMGVWRWWRGKRCLKHHSEEISGFCFECFCCCLSPLCSWYSCQTPKENKLSCRGLFWRREIELWGLEANWRTDWKLLKKEQRELKKK